MQLSRNGTRMTRIERIFAGICAHPFYPRYPRSIILYQQYQ